VGIPNEAYNSGFYSMRWMASVIFICVGYFATSMRLRKASLYRNHQSPVDFITDRFQSQLLRYTLVFLQVVPTVVYLSAQVIAIKNSFNGIFELDPDTAYPVVIVMAIILVFEWMGGLSSVALTDAFQAVVMMFAFFVLPIVIVKNFGGWHDFDYRTYPKPQHFQTLSIKQQWAFWQFSLVNMSFFTLPHLLQRIYAAKDLRSLKVGMAVLTTGPWFASVVGIFVGTVGVQILGGVETKNPVSDILEKVMELGGMALVVGVIFFTASLAAIMSTADSLMIAISQLITVEIVYPLRPKGTPAEMAFVGKFISFFATALSLLLGIYWDEGLSDLVKIQTPLSAQAVPPFLIGLYSSRSSLDIHPWCVAFGAMTATVYVITIYFGYLSKVDAPVGIDAGITGFCVQFTVILLLESTRRLLGLGKSAKRSDNSKNKIGDIEVSLLYPGRPSWDIPKLLRFGDHALTPELLWKSMEGVHEPVTNPWWVFTMFFSMTMVTPWTAEHQPPLDTSGSGNVFLTPPAIVGGLPWWVFKSLMMCTVPTILLFISIFQMPDDFPVDEVKIGTEGIDPDLVELTYKERGQRTSYDEPNASIRQRRSSIMKTMEELGLDGHTHEKRASIVSLNEGQRRLSAMALEGSRAFHINDKDMDVLKELDEEEGD
jgi:solute:Na+ symporter, SSS family